MHANHSMLQSFALKKPIQMNPFFQIQGSRRKMLLKEEFEQFCSAFVLRNKTMFQYCSMGAVRITEEKGCSKKTIEPFLEHILKPSPLHALILSACFFPAIFSSAHACCMNKIVLLEKQHGECYPWVLHDATCEFTCMIRSPIVICLLVVGYERARFKLSTPEKIVLHIKLPQTTTKKI